MFVYDMHNFIERCLSFYPKHELEMHIQCTKITEYLITWFCKFVKPLLFNFLLPKIEFNEVPLKTFL